MDHIYNQALQHIDLEFILCFILLQTAAIDPFVYLPEYPFVICKIRKFVCVANEVQAHIPNSMCCL